MTEPLFIAEHYGAIADGRTDCTEALQAALDEAGSCGSGVVVLSAGIYLSRTLYFRDGCVLRLERGAVLRASADWRSYGHPERRPLFSTGVGNPMWSQYWAFLVAVNCRGIGIEGEGLIDGQGAYGRFFPAADDPEGRRPFLIVWDRCRDCFLRGVTLKDPGAYTFLGLDVERMRVERVTIRSRDSVNGDGLDFDGGRDVNILDCDIDAGDDAVSLKTTRRGSPCERFVLSGCRLSSTWAALRLGTESCADMRDVIMRKCTLVNCRDGLKLQTCGGAAFERLTFADLDMTDVRRPVFFTANRFRMSVEEDGVRPAGGTIRGVTLRNLRVRAPGEADHSRTVDKMIPTAYDQAGFVISGTPQNLLQDIFIRDCALEFPGGSRQKRLDVRELYDYTEQYPEIPHFGELPSCGLYLRHIRNLRMENCRLTCQKDDCRPLLMADDVTGTVVGCTHDLPLLQTWRSEITGPEPLPLTPEEEATLARRDREAERFLAFAEEMGRAVDASEACPERIRLAGRDATSGSAVLPAHGRGYLLLPRVRGGFRVTTHSASADGGTIREFSLPASYAFVNRAAVAVGARESALSWSVPGLEADVVFVYARGEEE